MSDNWIRIIPTDPAFVPTASGAIAGRDLLGGFLRSAGSGATVDIVDFGGVVLVDAGSNFESATCPWCATAIDLGWWQDQVDVAAASGFTNLLTRTRCCDVTTSLNDLRYVWPQGFARWCLEAMNPGVGVLSDRQLESIGAMVGHEVRAVYAHL